MIDKDKMRAVLMGGAGIYLGYTAYSLFSERNQPDSAMAVWLNILISAVFLIAAILIVIFSVVLWKRAEKSQKEYEEAERQREAAEKLGSSEDHEKASEPQTAADSDGQTE